jgi:hypothetical protein
VNSWPDPEDFDEDESDGQTPFEPFDIYKLIGQALIAWACVMSLTLSLLILS